MKKPLQKNRGRLGIGLGARVWHQGRSVALIAERHWQAKPARELACKSLAGGRKRMRGTIRIDRKTHQQAVWLPLGEKTGDGSKSLRSRHRGNYRERSSAAGEAVTNRYANTRAAKIKGKPGNWACRGHFRRGQPPRRD
jgi:hypothetical protein